MGNKSVPKIITNNITDLFLSCYQHFGISNHNSFRVLLTKLLPYILFEKYIYILALKISSPGNQQYANCIGTLVPCSRKKAQIASQPPHR